MRSPPLLPALLSAALLLSGCFTRSVDVRPAPANPADFLAWGCTRIDEEQDSVQLRAADLAYAVDERAGNNIMALGLGVTLFWPAILAMRPAGLEAADLARLKGRYEALQTASRMKGCPALGPDLPAARAAQLPVAVGDQLLYEDRIDARQAAVEWGLRLNALRRGESEFVIDVGAGRGSEWRQDRAGNVLRAPEGALQWQDLLRNELVLGQVLAGEMHVVGDPLLRARLRGQVVALGTQNVADRRFEVAVIELFGDSPRGDSTTRVEGAMVVDRASGVLLRLDLRSAVSAFNLQRRLVRVASTGS